MNSLGGKWNFFEPKVYYVNLPFYKPVRTFTNYFFQLKQFSDHVISLPINRKRTYQDQFFNYGFIQIEDSGTMKPHCVVCMKVWTSESFKKSIEETLR